MRIKQMSVGLFCALQFACNPNEPIHLEPTIEEPPRLTSTIRMADPSSSGQLVRGFYPLEGNAWRWTGPRFAVTLGTPLSSRQNGAMLTLAFNLPENSMRALKKLTLTAKIGEMALAPEQYTTAGAHEYRRAVPAAVFTKDAVAAEFVLDKSFKPDNDERELGLVVEQIGLEPK